MKATRRSRRRAGPAPAPGRPVGVGTTCPRRGRHSGPGPPPLPRALGPAAGTARGSSLTSRRQMSRSPGAPGHPLPPPLRRAPRLELGPPVRRSCRTGPGRPHAPLSGGQAPGLGVEAGGAVRSGPRAGSSRGRAGPAVRPEPAAQKVWVARITTLGAQRLRGPRLARTRRSSYLPISS